MVKGILGHICTCRGSCLAHILPLAAGGKVVTLDQWWARLASLDLTPEERAAMATAFASGTLYAAGARCST
jgi:hypothetical protein